MYVAAVENAVKSIREGDSENVHCWYPAICGIARFFLATFCFYSLKQMFDLETLTCDHAYLHALKPSSTNSRWVYIYYVEVKQNKS